MRRARLIFAAAAAAILALGIITPTDAHFSAVTDNAANSWETTSVSPPSGLTLSQRCEPTVAIGFRAAAQATGNSTSLTVAKPSGVTTSDVMVAHLVTLSSSTLTAPAGWSLVRQDSATLGPYAYVYVKVATASEPTSYTWTKSGFSVLWAAGIGAWSGVSTVAPVHGHAGQVGSGTTITAPSVTATVADTRPVALFALRSDGGIAPPPGMTERWDIASSGISKVEAAGGDEAFVGPGTTGPRSATAAASAANVGQMILLSPRGIDVTAQWTATPSSFATGYTLQRWVGTTLQKEHTVTPATTTTHVDLLVAANTTYTYRLSAIYGNWRSSEVSASITTGPGC